MTDRYQLQAQREGRDTLLLIAVLAWTLVPQIGVLPVWSLVYAAVALGWRAVLCRTGGGLPPRRVLLTALPLAIGLTIWTHNNLLGRDAGTTLLVVLTGLKALEMRTQRDRFVLCFLGFMLVLAAFLQSQTILQALAMAVSVAGLLTCLLLANRPLGQPGLLESARLALLPPLLGLPLVLLLFLFFPRVPPLWSTGAGESARTGLSDRLEIGRFVENVLDDAPALQVRFDGPIPPEPERYFRAQVLSVHEDASWTMARGRPESLLTPLPLPRTEGPTLRYEMTVEPLGMRTLPLLELTTTHPEIEGATLDLVRHKDLHWEAMDPLDQRLRVRAEALPSGLIPTAVKPFPTAELGLPEGLHPRTRAWARTQRERQPRGWRPEQWSDWLLSEIRSGAFSYSLTPGLPRRPGDDPVDAFWLDHRQGFCEHYASSYVIVMRELGIPARIVTGYQGGQINPFDQVLEVRQSDAHAWAEYWSVDRGWVRVDPTAAVAPERIRESRRLRPPGLGGVLPTLGGASLESLRAIWGVVNHRWSLWVVGFTPRGLAGPRSRRSGACAASRFRESAASGPGGQPASGAKRAAHRPVAAPARHPGSLAGTCPGRAALAAGLAGHPSSTRTARPAPSPSTWPAKRRQDVRRALGPSHRHRRTAGCRSTAGCVTGRPGTLALRPRRAAPQADSGAASPAPGAC